MAQDGTGLLWVRPSRVARRLFFHLFTIGLGKFSKPRQFAAFEKPGAGLVWVASGHGHLRLDSGEWELRRGSYVWFYGTDQSRVFTPAAGQTLVTRTLWFGGPGLEAWAEELDIARQPEFRLRRPALMLRAYGKLQRLVRQQPSNWELDVHLQLVSMMRELLLARNVLVRGAKDQPEPITRALNALAADPHRNWGASELASITGVNYSSFRALFREHMRETVHEHLQRTRVDLAQVLLADERLRIKEVSRRLHFSTEYYFSNFFRKKTGMSPTEFRKHLNLRTQR